MLSVSADHGKKSQLNNFITVFWFIFDTIGTSVRDTLQKRKSVYRDHVSFLVHLSERCDGSITIAKREQSFGDGRIRSLDDLIDSVATVKGFGKKQRIR